MFCDEYVNDYFEPVAKMQRFGLGLNYRTSGNLVGHSDWGIL